MADAEAAFSTTGARTYEESVSRGYYTQHIGGLAGKHDNVRCYWEDQLTRIFLRPHINGYMRRTGKKQLRILDLGSGSGQGYEQLTHIPRRDLSLDENLEYVLTDENIALYLGVDLSQFMIEQGRDNYAHYPNVRFEQADLREGLGAAKAEKPFDIYYSSYGALSHLDYDGVQNLLTDIVDHADANALIVLDLLGRYSLEWPDYWQIGDNDAVRRYSMSYLYDEEERETAEIESFWMRYWTGEEIHRLCEQISQTSNGNLQVAALQDRSLMVGRHVDTREYGTFVPPLRRTVNRMHEDYLRTRLENLLVDYQPVEGFPKLNAFFEDLIIGWNAVVEFAITRLENSRIDVVDIEGWPDFSASTQMALMNMDRVVDSVAWMRYGDSRANVIEPQLGYILRTLEHNMQQGWGCGHSLLGVLQVG